MADSEEEKEEENYVRKICKSNIQTIQSKTTLETKEKIKQHDNRP
jgi:hypothetical protein